MTDLSTDLDVGAIVWSRARREHGGDVESIGGMVVDVGVTSTNEPFVVILDEHVVEPIRAWKVRNRVVARRIMLADVDEALTQPAAKTRMVGGARGALLTVGCGKGGFSALERELAYFGAVLLDESVRP